jgi:hypothetical protein
LRRAKPTSPSLALVVALARSTEPILEQVMRLQLAEHTCPQAAAVAEDARDSDLGVVVEDRPRHAAKEREGPDVAFAEGLRRLGRISRDKAGI